MPAKICPYCGGRMGHDGAKLRLYRPKVAEAACDVAPAGWRCSRNRGHHGPCAAFAVGGEPNHEPSPWFAAVIVACLILFGVMIRSLFWIF